MNMKTAAIAGSAALLGSALLCAACIGASPAYRPATRPLAGAHIASRPQGSPLKTKSSPSKPAGLIPSAQLEAAPVPASFVGKVGVLMYHDIEPGPAGPDAITPARFAAGLDGLRQLGYHFISLQQFRLFMEGQASVPQGSLLLTFDDGYESFYRYAYPILRQRGLSAACFVITGDFNSNALVYTPHMKPNEIAAMEAAEPDMEVQAHTDALHVKIDRSHDELTGRMSTGGMIESDAAYRARISSDTARCLAALQPLNSHIVDSFAYPYGLRNPEVMSMLRSHGIAYAFTTSPGLADRQSDRLQLPRINAGSPLITFPALASQLYALAAGSLYLPQFRAPAAHVRQIIISSTSPVP